MADTTGGRPQRGARDSGWIDRRAHRRVSVTAEVWIGQEGFFSRGEERLKDLSLGGAFIEFEGRYQPGAIFNLRIALEGAFINSTVIVRRALDGHGVGVQFLDLSPESQEHLAGFLERCAAPQAPA